MKNEPTGKARPREQHVKEGEREPARRPHRDEPERRPSEHKHGEWRGSGVCGDRHTD